MPTLFISDLHLRPDAPQLTAILRALLRGPATRADALYVLGDLFEAWPGDDDLDDPFNAPIVRGFAELSRHGVALHFQHGNRDFLLGERFAEATGGRLLPDEIVVDLDGTPTLLLHGDQLCIDDIAYQRFRAQVRDVAWQQAMLAQPLAVRKALARELRDGSDAAKAAKSMDIMDANADAVDAAFARHGVSRIIHGHTHRPAHHRYAAGTDRPARERIVLADWRDAGAYLAVDRAGAVAHRYAERLDSPSA